MSRLSVALCIAALVVAVSAMSTAGRYFPEKNEGSQDRSVGWSVYVLPCPFTALLTRTNNESIVFSTKVYPLW